MKQYLTTLLLSFFLLLSSALMAQYRSIPKEKYLNAILDLSNNRVKEAAKVFDEFYRRDSTNMNIAYLLGQSLVRLDSNLPYAIYLLEKASKKYSPDYKVLDPNEGHVSEYVFYYLIMAYSLHGDCDKTLQTLNKFYEIYSFQNEYYLVEGQRYHRECKQREKPEVENLPKRLSAEEKASIVGTKQVEYTNKQSTWGVQVGATLEPKFTWEFKGLKNVEVYVDKNGVYRYIIGRFVFKQQAEKLLEKVMEAGYRDAYVVNVKDKMRFSQQVITINNKPITGHLVGEVVYRVQVGAFLGDTIPDDLVDLFLILDDIEQINDGQWTYLTVGKFITLSEANFLKEIVQDMGVTDAFIAAFNYNRKVDIRQAEYYLEEQRRQRLKEVREEAGQINMEKKEKKK